jgi:hypothetical protein
MVLQEVVKLHWNALNNGTPRSGNWNALNNGPPRSGKTALECSKQWYSKK